MTTENDDNNEMTSQEEADSSKKKAVLTGPLPLDWTRVDQRSIKKGNNDDDDDDKEEEEDDHEHEIRYPWDVMEWNKQDDEVMFVGTSGQKITNMGMDLGDYCNPKLKKLIFRSCLIRKMEGLSTFQELELLELYDNIIESLGALNEGVNGAPGPTLRVLDMSYNVIRDMEPVKFCPNLRELYLANNKLKTLSGLSSLKHLVKIDLGANRIREMDGDELGSLINLEELWLGKNKIEKIQGLEKLTKLRRLDIQSNRLLKVEGLESQKDTLEELYLAHNGIDDEGASQPSGLGLAFSKLSTLDLSRNLLTTTQPFAHLETLDELWLSGNKVADFDQVSPLKALTSLDGIYLEQNPVAKDFEYRKKLRELIPSLTQIDASLIGGLGALGYTTKNVAGKAETVEEQMRRFQDMAFEKAKAQQAAASNNDNKTE